MKKTTIHFLPVLLFLAACGNEPKQKAADSSAATDSITDTKLPPATYLEGIYATTSAPGKGLENLFDANPGTIWQTQPGTGPDEGIMLYFQNALALNSIEIVTPDGIFAKIEAAEEKPILIYTNGQVAGAGLPNDKISLAQNGLVKSLFIRFPKTGKEVFEPLRQEVYRLTYPLNAFIAVSELKVVNDKGETLRLVPPRIVKGSVTASSTLMPETAYSAANLFDSRKEFVWAEGAASSGEGEILTFEFDAPVNITAVQIWDGYQRSDEHFSANARLRDFDFGEKGGTVRTYTLRDTKAGQKIELQTSAKGAAFELKVKSVYPGKNYKDLVLSDLVFYDGERPFILHSKLPENYQTRLRSKADNSPLAALLDKRIANEVQEDASSVSQSLILRSDGSFVLYSLARSDGEADISTFADGNWEILSNNQVKVFGKWTDLINLPDYYKGSAQHNPTRIFKDVLTIDATKVTGTKMVGTFYLK